MRILNRHFGLKLIALTLVVTIFATLLPSRLVTRAYAESSSDSTDFLNSDYSYLPYPESNESGAEPEQSKRSGLFAEYEQAALAKLGKPATVEDVAPYKRSDVSYEIPDISNAFTRNYALESGNYTRLIFGTPVNYKTSDEQWRKINLSLQKEEDFYQAQVTPYSLKFLSKGANDTNLLELNFGGITLAMSPVNIASDSAEAVYSPSPHTDDELLTENPCESGSIVYSDIFGETESSPSASLEYVLEPYKIKENILVGEGGYEQYVYSFKVFTDAYRVECKGDSVQLLSESGDAVFILSAAIMVDAKVEISDGLQLTLEQNETGYIVTIVADAEWINAPERVFPVAIDPTIDIIDPDSADAYEAVYVNSAIRGYGISVGHGFTSYIKLSEDLLTGLPVGSVISDATASFSGSYYSSGMMISTVAFRSELISSSWSPSSVYSGGSVPQVPSAYSGLTDSARKDCLILGTMQVKFDLKITEIIRSTLFGDNYGFALTTELLSGNFPTLLPMTVSSVQITYSDNSGLNSYQSTHSISIDGSGTAYIKDINGDLFFVHPGISTKGETLPVSIDLVYSSAFKGTATDSYYGSGWRLSIIQTMKAETVTDINGDTYTHYVLTDGTGGKHCFIHISGTIYTAEENPYWTYNSSTRLLDYGDGNTAEFNQYGYLTVYTNGFGDSYHVYYDGATPKITGVTDGNGVGITFMYGQPYLAGMVNLSCVSRAVSLTYTGSNLTKISTQVGESTNFVYNSNGTMSRFGYRKTTSETSDRQYVSFSYSSTAVSGIYPVSYVFKWGLWSGTSYSLQEIAYITYGGHTEYGHRYGSLSPAALYTEYIYFDRSGRTSTVFDSLGNVSGSDYEGGNLAKMNLLSGNTSAVMTDGNLVKDYTEKTGAWTQLTVSGSGDFSSVTSNSPFPHAKYGSDCFKLKSDSQSTEVYAKYPVPAAALGEAYTLSVEINPTNLTGSGGIVLGIMYNTSGSTGVKLLSSPMHYETNVCAQYTFEIPTSAIFGSVCILIGIKNQQGNLYFDLVSLTKGANSRATNQLSDSGFYNGTSAWTPGGTFTPSVIISDRINYVTIPGSINEERSLSQVLPTSVSRGGYLVVSGFGKGKAVTSGKFGIIVHFANTAYDDVELLFSNATEQWQFVSVIIPIENTSSYVNISLVNNYNYTDVCFGGVTAEYVTGLGDYADRSQYFYDELGRVTYEKSFSGGKTEYSYVDGFSESVARTVYTDKRRNTTTVDYTYNNTQNPFAVTQTTETFEPNIGNTGDIVTVTSYAYNSHGSLIELKTITDGAQTAHTMYSYTSNGRFLEKETDAAGRYITYSYQSSTGDLLSVTDGDGKVTSYIYDSYGRLTNETEGSASFALSYGQYNTNISHNGFSYSIGTDNAGNRTSFTILDSNGNLNRTMATYTYGGALGQISRLSYGNGQNKYYGYDSLGNLTFVSYTQGASQNTATFAWYYDQNGNVVKYVDRSDPSNPLTREYSYNPEGKLKYVISSDGNSVLYHYSTTENTDNEIFTAAGTGTVYTDYITRNDGARTITKTGFLGTKTIAYDSLERISSTSNGNVSKSYDYLKFSQYISYNGSVYYHRNETALIEEETCTLAAIPTITYTYYPNGKIETISENNVQTNSYEYDSLGQLVREDNKKLNGGIGYTIIYTYDSGGNMTRKRTFNYCPSVTTQSLEGSSAFVASAPYGYLNGFSDLLTTYYGTSTYFSYDAIGNPVSYLLKTLTWTRGNKLSSVKPYGSDYAHSYLYDADGFRTRKTLVSNAGVSTQINYFWVGNTLKSEWAENGSYEIVYDYDAIGRICGFAYSQNGGSATYYKYIRNAQGDVTHIVNNSGSVVAAYTYDTWGRLVSIKNGSGTDITYNTTSIGYINPIRYRGYYYDNETGFYYLQSRYYDPEMGRFINADSQLNVGEGPLGCNLFAYCGNDPVNFIDTSGSIPFMVITAAIGIVVGAIAGGIIAAISGGDVWAGIILGSLAGGLIGLGAGAAAATLLTGTVTATAAQVATGATLLHATISAGGLGAGLTYLADNFSRAVNGTGTVLYSGGEQALQAARDAEGKIILDSIGKAAEIITKDLPWEQAKPIWEQFSIQFCQQASGVVNVYICNSAYQGVNSIFWSCEMPALLCNSKVTEIIIHIFE